MSKKNIEKKSLGKNAILNAFKSGLAIIFPLITYPYAFRVLHSEGIGKVNYAQSIISYFTLLAALGISTYAVREGAKYRDNPEKFEVFCNQIFSLNIISTIFSLLLLYILVVTIGPLHKYKDLLVLLSFSILFTTAGIEWINTIFEDYIFITIRTIGTYIVTLVLLFVFVRNEDDYLKYALLNVVTTACICISNLVYCRKYIRIKFTPHINIKKHIKPVSTIFANSIAINIYVNSDTTMLGVLAGDHYVGLYALAVKIYSVVKTMMAAMYTVAVPRISYYMGKNDKESIRSVFTSLLSKLTVVLIPAGVGMILVSHEIVLLMGGEEYYEAITTLQILSISLIGAIFGGAITFCLNIPLGKEYVNAKATMLSALINVGLNIILIPIFKQNGAAFTTAISEFFVPIYCVAVFDDLNHYFNISKWRKNLFQALFGSILMSVIALIVKMFLSNIILRLVIVIGLSAFVYAFVLVLLKNEEMKKILASICGKKMLIDRDST